MARAAHRGRGAVSDRPAATSPARRERARAGGLWWARPSAGGLAEPDYLPSVRHTDRRAPTSWVRPRVAAHGSARLFGIEARAPG